MSASRKIGLLAAAALTMIAASPAMSQPEGAGELPTIMVGDVVTGELTADDHAFSDGLHYDCYMLVGEPGADITVTVTSDDFDTYLLGGDMSSCEEAAVADVVPMAMQNDDIAPDDTNSSFDIPIPTDGNYLIAVTHYTPGASGAYELSVTAAAASADGTAAPAPATPAAAN